MALCHYCGNTSVLNPTNGTLVTTNTFDKILKNFSPLGKNRWVDA